VPSDRYRHEVLRTVQRVTLDRLIERATDDPVPQVRAVLADRIRDLGRRLAEGPSPDAHERLAIADIERWLRRTAPDTKAPAPPAVPPGSPIGS
jgi:hypothetical protein